MDKADLNEIFIGYWNKRCSRDIKMSEIKNIQMGVDEATHNHIPA